MKQVIFEETRDELRKGVNIISDAVKTTFGAKGQNVIIENRFGEPHVTKDGVTVAESIVLSNNAQNMGAQVVKQGSSKTAEEAGDGTTQACVMIQALVNKGLDAIKEGKVKPIDLKRQIDEGVAIIVDKLKESAIPVQGNLDMIKAVATISANNDEVLGGLICDAFEKMGLEGTLTVEQSKTVETYTEISEGTRIEKGYISHYFINQQGKNVCELEEPLILLTENEIHNVNEILPLAEYCAQNKKPFVIISPNVGGEALTALVTNTVKGAIQCCVIQAPEFGNLQTILLEDIAKLTGGVLLGKSNNYKIAQFTQIPILGTCKKIKIGKTSTIFIGSKWDRETAETHKQKIVDDIATAQTEIEKKFHEKRMANLFQGIGVVYVGAPTEAEMKEKKDRIDDAIRATKSAIEEGVGVGGGLSYYNKIKYLNKPLIGFDILKDALVAPIVLLHENSGIDFEPNKISDTVGYNAKTERYEDLLEAGVLDPIKVSRCALQNAASAAGMILLTNCLVLNETK
jgi:chaperonin GroEL